MKWLETHKQLAMLICIIAGVLLCQHFYQNHKERMADKQQTTTDALLKAKDAQISDNHKQFDDFKATVLQEMQSIKTAKQALTVIQPTIPGPAISQGVIKADLPASIQVQLPGDPNTHYTLFNDEQTIALAKNAEQCRIDEAGLTTCQKDKQAMQDKIDGLTKANAAWQKAGTVGRWTAGLGVSKTTNGNYKPAGYLDYRLTHNIGLGFGAVNNAAFANISIHFGGKPK